MGATPLGTAPAGTPTGSPSVGRLRRLSWLWVPVATQDLNFVPSLILLGSIVVPASVLVFAASSGRQVIAPAGLLALVAVLEYDALLRLRALPMIMVGLIEESAELIVPLLVLISSRHRSPRAGVIIGVASGMASPRCRRWATGSTRCSAAATWPRCSRPCCCGPCSPLPSTWPGRAAEATSQ